jgi:hypothetical protein
MHRLQEKGYAARAIAPPAHSASPQAPVERSMSSTYREIRSGADGWPHAPPSLEVWPPQVVAELS